MGQGSFSPPPRAWKESPQPCLGSPLSVELAPRPTAHTSARLGTSARTQGRGTPTEQNTFPQKKMLRCFLIVKVFLEPLWRCVACTRRPAGRLTCPCRSDTRGVVNASSLLANSLSSSGAKTGTFSPRESQYRTLLNSRIGYGPRPP